MMHRLTAVRRSQQQARSSFKGEPLIRPIMTGTARRNLTPSDLEAMETISLPAHKANGDFWELPGFDDIPAYP